MACLELECNQTFLGMIQLQYQAVVEIVQLIDLLEKACIRFVHFSKESELRSRIFSEKMGLESGWNCHISLKSNDPTIPRTVSCLKTTTATPCHSDKHKKARGSKKHVLEKSKMGASLPDKLNRPAWYLDFPRWQETRAAAGNWERKELMAAEEQQQQQPMHTCTKIEGEKEEVC